MKSLNYNSQEHPESFDHHDLYSFPVTDVAVVKIQAHNLPAVELGNSDLLQPGE
jgi:S1-C subfamily serine protease